MNILFFSMTNNIHTFYSKINKQYEIEHKKPKHNFILLNSKNIQTYVPDDNFILLTPTSGFGEVPPAIDKFLQKNHDLLAGIIGSGNKNWGVFYGKAADIISQSYNVPLLMKFELSGTTNDITKFINILEDYEAPATK